MSNESNVVEFLCEEEMVEIFNAVCKRQPFELGFNPFALMSDMYARENFHSDIIKELLDPNGSHQCGDIFLVKFLEFVKKTDFYSEGNEITVTREMARIDVAIWNDTKKTAIIIENKINNANDQYRQLPNYRDEVNRKDYTPELFVYLSLENRKGPNETGWNEDEKEFIRNRLVSVVAFNHESKDNLVDSWLHRCMGSEIPCKVRSVVEQYSDVIKKLTYGTIMEELKRTIEKIQECGLLNAEGIEGIQKVVYGIPMGITRQVLDGLAQKGLVLGNETVGENGWAWLRRCDKESKPRITIQKSNNRKESIMIVEAWYADKSKSFVDVYPDIKSIPNVMVESNDENGYKPYYYALFDTPAEGIEICAQLIKKFDEKNETLKVEASSPF